MPDEADDSLTWYWGKIIREHGQRGVVSVSITDEELAQETQRQAAAVFPLIEPLLRGEITALDYGCGAGRFTHYLAVATNCLTTGYDHCADFTQFWTESQEVDFTSDRAALVDGSYEVVFVWGVLGDPHLNPEAVAADIALLAAPNALIVLTDHMSVDGKERWWQFRSEESYRDLFERNDIQLRLLGRDKQLENPVSILAGRKAR